MIRLIACDIDGTLLRGTQREISPAVFREVVRLGKQGVRFCPASGRQYHSLRRLFAPAADELTYLCENGALNALMTGSGSAVFGIFSEKSLAENAAKRMPKAFGACFLAEPVNG